MRNQLTLALLVGFGVAASAQFKPELAARHAQSLTAPAPRDVSAVSEQLRAVDLAPAAPAAAEASAGFVPRTPLPAPKPKAGPVEALSATQSRATASTPRVAAVSELSPARVLAADAADAARMQLAATPLPQLREPAAELELTRESFGSDGTRHLRLRQTYGGVPVYGGELILHQSADLAPSATGRVYPTPKQLDLAPKLSAAAALDRAYAGLAQRASYPAGSLAERLHAEHAETAELMIVHHEGAARLAYVAEVMPTLGEHYVVFVDAHTGEEFDRYSTVCGAAGGHAHLAYAERFGESRKGDLDGEACVSAATTSLPPPPRTSNATDLNGRQRTLQTYELSGRYYLIDLSRPMAQGDISTLGDERGALVTADANNTNPQNNDFDGRYVNEASNSFGGDASEVSVHYNTEQAYEYFRAVHGRNSLDGSGGNVYAFANVSNRDGSRMDNAFYVGGRLFYGNGDRAFRQLAGGLDVGAHELAHGVIDYSARLEYRDESGALNEHFADVFGVMVDRDDWTLGEEIVQSAVFSSGAMRSMADPTQGLRDGQPGYQPGTYAARYVGSNDNGGVHINSGIPNNVAYQVGQAIGREKTEAIWYDLLTNYLTRRSDFEDFRNALQQAVERREGRGSAAWNAAVQALDGLGFPGTSGGSGGGGGPVVQPDNPGGDFVAHADAANDVVRLSNLSGQQLIADITPSYFPKSRTSVTDDGSLAVLATRDGDINLIRIDYAGNTVTENLIEGDLDGDGQGDIRNVVVSRDGAKLAFLTEDLDPFVYVYDATLDRTQSFELYSPDSNGEPVYSVSFADALEFDYSGNYLLYDALNDLGANGLDLDSWDIGFLRVGDGRGGFGDGLVLKLFANIEPGVSVGNPSISKRTETVIAFDYLGADGVAEVRTIDIETGAAGTIRRQDVLGFPSYVASDGQLVWSATTTGGEAVIAITNLSPDKLSPSGDAAVLVGDASRATAFGNGSRTITSAVYEVLGGADWAVAPNPTADVVRVFRRADAPVSTLPFEVLDASGARRLMAPARATELDLSGLAPGAYLVRQGERAVRVLRR